METVVGVYLETLDFLQSMLIFFLNNSKFKFCFFFSLYKHTRGEDSLSLSSRGERCGDDNGEWPFEVGEGVRIGGGMLFFSSFSIVIDDDEFDILIDGIDCVDGGDDRDDGDDVSNNSNIWFMLVDISETFLNTLLVFTTVLNNFQNKHK